MPEITIHCSDGQFTAYLAKPNTMGCGGILVIQEIFGVNEDMRAHCDELATKGYFAICPDLFWRQEPKVQLTDKSETEWAKAFELYKGFDVEKGTSDLLHSLKYLRQINGCNGKVGTVGFCLGGYLAYKMAVESDAECNVSYYGVGIEDQIGESDKINNSTILHIAENDSFVSKEAQLSINEGLKNHSHITVFNYPNVDHAFARHNGVNFDEAAARLADERSMKLFAEKLN